MTNKYKSNDAETQVFAAFVHGALFGLHALGVVYNVKRKNVEASVIHSAVGLWDLVATYKHYKQAKNG